jgi:hypothetical protein
VGEEIAGEKSEGGKEEPGCGDSEKVIHPWSKSAGEGVVLWEVLPDFGE